jgi:parallel beta-helix repeat protein
VNITSSYANTWDDGYPSGGNYWSDYTGVDLKSGSHQNETGSDEIGDTPYNQDNYPLMRPYVPFENQTIYIRADGGIDPSGVPIHRKGDLYFLTGNITSDADGIVVERNDIILDGAGYTVKGTGGGYGITLSGRSGVTIKNTDVEKFTYGIMLYASSNNSIVENNIANNAAGISLGSSSNNSVSGNNITANPSYGIHIENYSSDNSVSGNNIANNANGIYLTSSSSNSICHNNFIQNDQQVHDSSWELPMFVPSTNIWDDGYPSGGNYWSDSTGVDADGDGIGDAAYTIDANNTDRYPLMGKFSDFNATSEYRVQTICNSSISDFQFSDSSISFNVTGEDGTAGFCRICIPTALMNVTYRVFINGTEVQCNLLPCSNSSYSYLYFTYTIQQNK